MTPVKSRVELVRRYRKPSFEVRRDRLDTSTTVFTYLNFRGKYPKSLEEWFEITKTFQDLLTLAMDAPCAVAAAAAV